MIREMMAALEEDQKKGIEETEFRARRNMRTLSLKAGTDFGDLVDDGAYAEYIPSAAPGPPESDGNPVSGPGGPLVDV